MKKEQPPHGVKFCWECGQKLWAGATIFVLLEVEGHERVLHKSCAKLIKDGQRRITQ